MERTDCLTFLWGNGTWGLMTKREWASVLQIADENGCEAGGWQAGARIPGQCCCHADKVQAEELAHALLKAAHEFLDEELARELARRGLKRRLRSLATQVGSGPFFVLCAALASEHVQDRREGR